MKRIKSYAFVLALLFGLVAVVPSASVGAINVFQDACRGNNTSEVCKAKSESINPVLKTIVNLLLFAIGTISVIMIIVGGIRYTTSNGDSSKIKSAKDTVLYSVVGLIVALLAFVIVQFVVTQFG